MPISEIQQIPIGKLRPNPANTRVHPKRQIAQLARGIEKFGFVAPIIADENFVILAGHARAAAGQAAGLAKAAQRFLERLSLIDIEGVMRGDQFGDQLGELPELDQACGGVVRSVPKVAFGQRTELHQFGVVYVQKAEICGLHRRTTPPPAIIALFGGDWLIPRDHS
jgi:hypothetical protein